eukprot:576043-Rhodomonas_salina.1
MISRSDSGLGVTMTATITIRVWSTLNMVCAPGFRGAWGVSGAGVGSCAPRHTRTPSLGLCAWRAIAATWTLDSGSASGPSPALRDRIVMVARGSPTLALPQVVTSLECRFRMGWRRAFAMRLSDLRPDATRRRLLRPGA